MTDDPRPDESQTHRHNSPPMAPTLAPNTAPGQPIPPPKTPVYTRAKETANTGYLALRWGLMLILAVIALVFIVRNFENVPVDWVFRSSSVPLSVIMIAFLVVGFVIGWLVHWFSDRNHQRS